MQPLFPNTRLLLARDDPKEYLEVLETLAMDALRSGKDDELTNVTSAILSSNVPALGILVARGMIPVLPPKEALPLLDKILATRVRLELSDEEPYGDILEMILARRSKAASRKGAEALQLANQKLEAKAGEVRKMKQSLDELKH